MAFCVSYIEQYYENLINEFGADNASLQRFQQIVSSLR